MAAFACNEVQLTALTIGSYLAFYSCYDKQTKRLNVTTKLRQIFGCRNIRYSLAEINKVLALSGLTLYSYSFINIGSRYDINLLRKHSLYLLTMHGSYSFFTFRDRYFGPKRFAMFFGSCSLTLMFSIYFEALSNKYSLLSLICATIHFYTMESKPNGLQIRPFGYIALVASLAGIAAIAWEAFDNSTAAH